MQVLQTIGTFASNILVLTLLLSLLSGVWRAGVRERPLNIDLLPECCFHQVFFRVSPIGAQLSATGQLHQRRRHGSARGTNAAAGQGAVMLAGENTQEYALLAHRAVLIAIVF
jgi:hypothetical protein